MTISASVEEGGDTSAAFKERAVLEVGQYIGINVGPNQIWNFESNGLTLGAPVPPDGSTLTVDMMERQGFRGLYIAEPGAAESYFRSKLAGRPDYLPPLFSREIMDALNPVPAC